MPVLSRSIPRTLYVCLLAHPCPSCASVIQPSLRTSLVQHGKSLPRARCANAGFVCPGNAPSSPSEGLRGIGLLGSSAWNGTAPAGSGNSTVLDDGSAGNSTLPGTNSTTSATNGTGTSTNATDTPEPSGGSTRRSLAPCAYECPPSDLSSHTLLLETVGDGTFTCTFASGSCTYQSATGVLNEDNNGGACRSGAITYTPGCLAGDANNGGVIKKRRASKHRRSSREMQYEAIARRFLL